MLKKVIYICNFSAEYGGNFLASMNGIGKSLVKKNVSVVFIFPETVKNKKWEINLSDYKVLYVNFNDNSAMLKVVDREMVNDCILHLHFTRLTLVLKLKAIMKKYGHSYLLYQEHMYPKDSYLLDIKGHLLSVLVRNAYFIGVSPGVYKTICNMFGEKRCYLLRNAIDLTRLNHNSKDKRENSHLPNSILIFGSDFYRKGVDLAINAMSKSEKLKDKCNLIVVTHNKNKTEKIINDLFGELPSYVHIHKPSKDVSELYKNSFIFLSPSRSEAFGYAPVEASYYGLQVIASDIPGQNTLKNISSIQWIKKGDVIKLKELMENAYNNRKKFNNEEARQYIKTNYSLEEWISNLLNIYEKLILK